MTNPECWKIYPTEKSWLICLVWENVEDMREAMVDAGTPGKKLYDYKDVTAGCQCQTKKWNSKKGFKVSGPLGVLYFAKRYCSIGTIMHEIQHFLSHWIKGMKWEKKLTTKYSEPIAKMSDTLVSQFLNNYHRTFIEGKSDMPTQLYKYIQE